MNIYIFFVLSVISTAYYYKLKHKNRQMNYIFNSPPLLKNMISYPDSQSMIFPVGFNEKMKDIVFPDSIESITICSNIEICNIYFPNTVKHISFLRDFNLPINDINFPPTLKELTICGNFDNSINYITFPDTIEILRLGGKFNHSINKLNFPNSLHTLYLEGDFNHPFVNIKFSPNLKHLIFNGKFNQVISKVNFPQSLETLELCGNFNKPIDEFKSLLSLKKITFGEKYKKSLNNIQFEVEELVFYNISHDVSNLPPSVKKIKLMNRDLITKIKKIPHNCIVVDRFDNILNV